MIVTGGGVIVMTPAEGAAEGSEKAGDRERRKQSWQAHAGGWIGGCGGGRHLLLLLLIREFRPAGRRCAFMGLSAPARALSALPKGSTHI